MPYLCCWLGCSETTCSAFSPALTPPGWFVPRLTLGQHRDRLFIRNIQTHKEHKSTRPSECVSKDNEDKIRVYAHSGCKRGEFKLMLRTHFNHEALFFTFYCIKPTAVQMIYLITFQSKSLTVELSTEILIAVWGSVSSSLCCNGFSSHHHRHTNLMMLPP